MEKEKELQLNEALLVNETLMDIVKRQNKSIKKITRAWSISAICFTAVIITMIVSFFWYESQFKVTDVVTTTTTTTQEVSGENSEINNVEGDMYKDSATHNNYGSGKDGE